MQESSFLFQRQQFIIWKSDLALDRHVISNNTERITQVEESRAQKKHRGEQNMASMALKLSLSVSLRTFL